MVKKILDQEAEESLLKSFKKQIIFVLAMAVEPMRWYKNCCMHRIQIFFK